MILLNLALILAALIGGYVLGKSRKKRKRLTVSKSEGEVKCEMSNFFSYDGSEQL